MSNVPWRPLQQEPDPAVVCKKRARPVVSFFVGSVAGSWEVSDIDSHWRGADGDERPAGPTAPARDIVLTMEQPGGMTPGPGPGLGPEM